MPSINMGRTKRPLAIAMVIAILAVLPLRGATARGAHQAPSRIPASLSAELECVEGGGANVTFAVRNAGNERLYIKNDFHLALDRVRGSTRKMMTIAFVFPARGFRAIPPGEERVFLVPLATALPGEEAGDLRGKALILEAEVWFHGYGDRPLRRDFTFPGCP